MARIIDPPWDECDQLPTPLTDGERQVIGLFDQKLPSEWEIYVQPHLNGLRPDIVLLHPGLGVAVFEVKDWNLGAMQYYTEEDGFGRPVLWASDKNGRRFSREADNPINKILLYEKELFEIYCPRLDGLDVGSLPPGLSSRARLNWKSSASSSRFGNRTTRCKNTCITTRFRVLSGCRPATSEVSFPRVGDTPPST